MGAAIPLAVMAVGTIASAVTGAEARKDAKKIAAQQREAFQIQKDTLETAQNKKKKASEQVAVGKINAARGRKAAGSKGARGGTILTGPQGVPGSSSKEPTTLLGA